MLTAPITHQTERFHSRDVTSGHSGLLNQKTMLSILGGLVWYINMAAVSLLRNSNMAAMTSNENAF